MLGHPVTTPMWSGWPGVCGSRYQRFPHIPGSSGLTGVDWLGIFLSPQANGPVGLSKAKARS